MTRVATSCFALVTLLVAACSEFHELEIPEDAHIVHDNKLDEMSGIKVSYNHTRMLWALNDGENFSRLYRLGLEGESYGHVSIRGAFIFDSESIAIWREHDTIRDWVLIGDTGDNLGIRTSLTIHAVPEPGLDDTETNIAWSFKFTYPDGQHNTEAIAVDNSTGSLLVLDKSRMPGNLYTLSLPAARATGEVILEPLHELPASVAGPFTSMDISGDGSRLAILTYKRVYHWSRETGETWPQVLAVPPQTIELPELAKAEAITFSADEPRYLYVGSEKLPAVLLGIDLHTD